MQYSFQSEHCSLDSDYNGMQAVSSVTAPGASDGQVEEKEEKVEEKEESVAGLSRACIAHTPQALDNQHKMPHLHLSTPIQI